MAARSMTRRSLAWIASACVALGLLSAVAPVQSASYEEDSVKAAFLYRFTGYVEWPAAAVAGEQFTFAVLGADLVATELKKLVPRHTIHGLPGQVRVISGVQELGEAQVLYVGDSYKGNLERLLRSIGSKPVLVVTDRQGALDAGAAVNFIKVDRRVRFEISLAAAAHAQLKIGADLLSVAARVRGAPLRTDTLCIPPLMFDGSDPCVLRVAQR
jgi:hypothetical protein